MEIILYIIAGLLILSSFSIFTGSNYKVGMVEQVLMSLFASVGGVVSIVYTNWYIVLSTILIYWITYGIGIWRGKRIVKVYDSAGKNISYQEGPLSLQKLVKMTYEVAHEETAGGLKELKKFFDKRTDKIDLKNTPIEDYPSVKPDHKINYHIALNKYSGAFEIFEKNNLFVHIGFQIVIPKARKTDKSKELHLLTKILQVIRPNYGEPKAKDNEMMVFNDEKTNCLIFYQQNSFDQSGKSVLLTLRFFNKQFWDPEKENLVESHG